METSVGVADPAPALIPHPISLARPLRIAPSAWLAHVPFGMFIIDLVRPRTFVELGTHYGVSYCAICQAVKSLNLDTRCFAVDTWQGDAQTGYYGEEVLQDLRNHHDPLYGAFSQLIRSTFDEALPHFGDCTVDLLHIDGCHTYEAVRHDFETWLSKMSRRGVVMLHDIAVQDGDFGVWRLWKEVKAEYPHFEFAHGHGLGILAVGPGHPASLDALLAASSEEQQIREYFLQLGSRLEQEAEILALKAREEKCRAQIAKLEKERDAIRGSAFWRMTRPLRSTLSRHPGLRGILRRVGRALWHGFR